MACATILKTGKYAFDLRLKFINTLAVLNDLSMTIIISMIYVYRPILKENGSFNYNKKLSVLSSSFYT
jgi:hypothetical protein